MLPGGMCYVKKNNNNKSRLKGIRSVFVEGQWVIIPNEAVRAGTDKPTSEQEMHFEGSDKGL